MDFFIKCPTSFYNQPSVHKILRWTLLLSGVASAVNLLVLYFFPMSIPLANFSIVKLAFIGMVERKYSYILISVLLILVILSGAVSIKRNGVLFPCLNLMLFLGDLIGAGFLFITDLLNGYMNTLVLSSGIVDIIVIVLSVLYFVGRIRLTKQNKEA